MKSKCKMPRVALLVGAMVLSTGAMASPPEGTAANESQRIQYSRLHASESAGAAELYQRLRAAARTVCWKAAEHRPSVAGVTEQQYCVDNATATAVASINIAAVTAMHKQGRRAGKAEATMVAKQ